MRRHLLALIFVIFSTVGFGQTFLLQENFSGGIPSGWQVIDADGYPLHSSMTQFTSAWIPYIDGTDTCVASSSYFDDTLQAEDYLVLPKLNLLTFSKLSWESRSVDAAYPDGYYVLLSTTDSNTASFTDTLLTVHAENPIRNRKSILLDTMGYANQAVFIAFRNKTEDGFILVLDEIWVEASDFASAQTEKENTFVIYPNPASDYLNIQSDKALSVTIHDLQGRLLYSGNKNRIDIAAFETGQYIITVLSSDGAYSQPFIKQ